jgi:lipoprotein-anchoring transpeptidase ErfK/SrfK
MHIDRRSSLLILSLIVALFVVGSDVGTVEAKPGPPMRFVIEPREVEEPAGEEVFEGGPCLETLTVQPGNTLGEIALMCQTSLQEILDLNPGITNPNIIHVGQELSIPPFDGPPIYTTNVTVPEAPNRPQDVGESERWINVDLGQQLLVAYEGNTPVFQSYISSGLPQYPTVTGQYRINRRYEIKDMDGRPLGYDYYLEDVPFTMFFYKAYALHGTYWHGNYGTPMSHGCVNLPTPAAEWIFNWSEMGTVVNVHA